MLYSLVVIKADTSRAESINCYNLSLSCLPEVVMGSKPLWTGCKRGDQSGKGFVGRSGSTEALSCVLVFLTKSSQPAICELHAALWYFGCGSCARACHGGLRLPLVSLVWQELGLKGLASDPVSRSAQPRSRMDPWDLNRHVPPVTRSQSLPHPCSLIPQ